MWTDEYRSLDPLRIRIDTHRRYTERPDDLDGVVVRATGLGPDGHLLDVGCGTGAFLTRMRAAGRRVVGLDGSPAAVEAVHGTGIPAVRGLAEALPFVDGRFDAVTARHMLYHVPDPVAAIAEARRVLRPGGTFVAVVNVVDATPALLGLAGDAVAAAGLARSSLRFSVHGDNLPGLVARVFDPIHVERHDNALVFDRPEPMAAYAVSSLLAFGVPDDHPLRRSIVDDIGARSRALFAGRKTYRDPKGYVIVTARA